MYVQHHSLHTYAIVPFIYLIAVPSQHFQASHQTILPRHAQNIILTRSLLPTTQASPRIRTLLPMTASRVLRVPTRSCWVARGLHGRVFVAWWGAGRRWRRLPACWDLLAVRLLLLLLAVLSRAWRLLLLAEIRRWGEVLLVGWWGDGPIR